MPKFSSNNSTGESKYIQVTNEFRARILCGEYQPGERLPSYNQARILYGVHTNTMEKVYAQLVAEGLVVRRNGSGTYVSQSPKPPRQTTKIIGLSGAGFSFTGYSPYWAHLLGGVREAAVAAGMQTLLLDPRSADGWEKADGVLMCDWDNPEAPRKVVPDQPLVSLMTPVKGIASVYADDENGAYQATQHLIALGHSRIGYFHQDPNDAAAQRRIAGYRQALQDARIQAKPEWAFYLLGKYEFDGDYKEGACAQMALLLREGWKEMGCTALLCANDEAAVGVIAALEAEGLRVPQDVSVVGFDGTEFCELTRPKLSSVEVPLREIGAAGVNLLMNQIGRDEISEEHLVLPMKFRERESTQALQ